MHTSFNITYEYNIMNVAVTIMFINASKAHQLSTGNENYSFN